MDAEQDILKINRYIKHSKSRGTKELRKIVLISIAKQCQSSFIYIEINMNSFTILIFNSLQAMKSIYGSYLFICKYEGKIEKEFFDEYEYISTQTSGRCNATCKKLLDSFEIYSYNKYLTKLKRHRQLASLIYLPLFKIIETI